MAEVANLAQAPASEHSSVSAVTLAADVPEENIKNEVNDLGTSPNNEKSSNSHHSEYDTASDLEGGAHDDYNDDDDDDDDEDDDGDEEDDDDDESLEDVGHTDTDSLEFDAERQRGDGQETTDYTKKVDEDRSNPQYIPKKGTFYEHDDRTADEPEGTLSQVTEISEDGEVKALSPTTISQASKTMKKWQPASGGDRWSHDRFDSGEQAPKSRAELVSAYGYDIRNEDGPPRARRRRRYARGPSKYSRNWEDETAYIKASNAQRKPPNSEDFPALEERQKARKSRSYRDEKENRFDRPQTDRPRVGAQQTPNRENKEHVRRSTGNSKNFRQGVRQPPMDFKNKNRSGPSTGPTHGNSSRGSNIIDKDENIVRSIVNQPATETNSETSNFQKLPNNNKAMNLQQAVKVINQQAYNGYDPGQQNPQSINNPNSGGYNNAREIGEKVSSNHSGHTRQTNSSNLSARLQQAQNRNDPSHVGSVQMHTLATQHNIPVINQNALQNPMLDLQQHQQQVANQQEHARTKRYSSLRQRSQLDATGGVPNNPHLDQHTLQQLHMQHEVQQQQQIATNVHPTQPMMIQEQHLIPANIMHLYQENLQAQMQALQVSGLPQAAASLPLAAGKQPYTPIQQQYAPTTSVPPAAGYYTPTAPDYSSPPPAAVPPQSQYTQQPTAFLQTQSATAPLAFNSTASQPLTQAAMAPPTISAPATAAVPPSTVNYVQNTSQNPSATSTAAYPSFPNYQNFNTVGGTTYFVPSPQPTARPVVLPQRRPTNAIPILPPSEKTKRSQESKDDESKNSSTSGSTPGSSSNTSANAPIGSAENIDHILDNMFVQRPAYQPQTRKSSSPPSDDAIKSTSTSSIASASAQGDLSSVGKSRTHEPSANASKIDPEPTTTKQFSVPVVGAPNVAAMVPSTANAEADSALSEAPPSESIPQ